MNSSNLLQPQEKSYENLTAVLKRLVPMIPNLSADAIVTTASLEPFKQKNDVVSQLRQDTLDRETKMTEDFAQQHFTPVESKVRNRKISEIQHSIYTPGFSPSLRADDAGTSLAESLTGNNLVALSPSKTIEEIAPEGIRQRFVPPSTADVDKESHLVRFSSQPVTGIKKITPIPPSEVSHAEYIENGQPATSPILTIPLSTPEVKSQPYPSRDLTDPEEFRNIIEKSQRNFQSFQRSLNNPVSFNQEEIAFHLNNRLSLEEIKAIVDKLNRECQKSKNCIPWKGLESAPKRTKVDEIGEKLKLLCEELANVHLEKSKHERSDSSSSTPLETFSNVTKEHSLPQSMSLHQLVGELEKKLRNGDHIGRETIKSAYMRNPGDCLCNRHHHLTGCCSHSRKKRRHHCCPKRHNSNKLETLIFDLIIELMNLHERECRKSCECENPCRPKR